MKERNASVRMYGITLKLVGGSGSVPQCCRLTVSLPVAVTGLSYATSFPPPRCFMARLPAAERLQVNLLHFRRLCA